MSENNINNGNGNDEQQNPTPANDDLQKLMMAGLGAVAHFKEKSSKWFDEMAAKGKDAAQDMQPTIDDWAKKGQEALQQGKTFGADALGKLQKTIDGLKEDAKTMGFDEMIGNLGNMSEDALKSLRDKIDEALKGKDTPPSDGPEA